MVITRGESTPNPFPPSRRTFYKPDEDTDTEYDELFEVFDMDPAGGLGGADGALADLNANLHDSDDSFDPNAATDSDDEEEAAQDMSPEDDDDDHDDDSNDNEEQEEEAATAASTRNSAPAEDIEVDDEEEIVNRIISETKKEQNHPPDIKTDEFVVDISFHPISDLVAVALITGDVALYKYSLTENTLVSTYETHTKACRDVEFSDDGDTLFSASKDKGIVLTDVNTGKMIRFYDNAHEAPIYTLHTVNENVFATGDEDGHLKVWDLRSKDTKPLFSLKEVDDYISCIVTNEAKKMLLMTSGDGYLTSVNLGARKMFIQSEQYEEELTSMGLFRNDQKLIVGTSKGKMYTFNWGEFGYHCDAYPAFKTGINAMIPVTQRMAVMGCEDGLLRAANTVPGKQLGIVGQHSMAVETMDICNTGEFIASSSHDNDIRFWNIKYFEDFEAANVGEKITVRKERTVNLPSSKFASSSNFFAGLANSSSSPAGE